MEESILKTIQKLIGDNPDSSAFEMDLIVHINTILNILHQLGVPSESKFVITGPDEVWGDYLDDELYLDMVKTYVYTKCRMIFDPPTGTLKDALDQIIKELEWRINVEVDNGK
ncbi:MAG: hypothetical protein HUJ78_01185 [Mogibacterium sp.]|nr:hypothetical protein [Mogibacterium sp.]